MNLKRLLIIAVASIVIIWWLVIYLSSVRYFLDSIIASGIIGGGVIALINFAIPDDLQVSKKALKIICCILGIYLIVALLTSILT